MEYTNAGNSTGSILNRSISGTALPAGAATTLRTTRMSYGSRPAGSKLNIVVGFCTPS